MLPRIIIHTRIKNSHENFPVDRGRTLSFKCTSRDALIYMKSHNILHQNSRDDMDEDEQSEQHSERYASDIRTNDLSVSLAIRGCSYPISGKSKPQRRVITCFLSWGIFLISFNTTDH